MSIRLRILVLALVLASSVGWAEAADKWAGLRANDILIVGDASEVQMRHTAEVFAQLRDAVNGLMPGKLQSPTISTTVILFKNDAAEKPYKAAANSTGLFQPGTDVNYISLNADLDIPSPILREYTHVILRDMTDSANLPLWFRDGIADYFSTIEVSTRDRKYVLGHPVADHTAHLSKAQLLLPLETLFEVTRESPQYVDKDKRAQFDAESWALVHYLMLAEGGKHQNQFADFVNATASGKAPIESFKVAFQMDLPTVQKDLERSVHAQSSLSPSTSAMKPASELDKEFNTAPVSDAESLFYLGDLMFHTNHLSEADELLKKAIVADPNLAEALASLGMLRMKQKKYGEAVDLLKKAAGLDSKNYLVHYDYAYLLQQELQDTGDLAADKLDATEAEYRKAIVLAPWFVQSYEMLAYFNLIQGQDIPETIQMVKKARTYSPGRDNLTLMLAQLEMHEKEFSEARVLLTSLKDSTSADPSLRHTAENLLDDLAGLEAVQRDRARREQTTTRTEVIEVAPDSTTPATVNIDPLGNGPKTGLGVIEEITPARAKVQGEHVSGMLTLVDCRNGLTLTLKTDKGEVKLHTDNPGNVQFVSYSSDVPSELTCGPAKAPGVSVAITYKPGGSPDSLGEPLLVEFLAKSDRYL